MKKLFFVLLLLFGGFFVCHLYAREDKKKNESFLPKVENLNSTRYKRLVMNEYGGKNAQAHNAEADKRTLQRKLAASERRVQDLGKRLTEQHAASEERVRSLTEQMSHEMAKVSDMMQQLVSYMMGKGDVTLAGTIHETVVAGIREEVRQEFLAMFEEKDARIAAVNDSMLSI